MHRLWSCVICHRILVINIYPKVYNTSIKHLKVPEIGIINYCSKSVIFFLRFLQQLLDTSLIHVNRGLVSAVTAGKRSDAIAAIWGVILCLICPLHIQRKLESDAVVSALVQAHFSILNSGSLSLKVTDRNRVLRKSESQGRINRNRICGCPLPCLTIISMACHISRLNMNNIKNVV